MTQNSNAYSQARFLYWGALIAGALLTVGLGFWDVWVAVPAIAAVFWMLLYLATSRTLTPEAFRHPDFADAFYYMGFLLTLVALVSTLVRVGADRDDLQEFVLGQFGLALATTIVGLGGRTTLRLFRERSEGPGPTRATEDLRRASERFRIVLDNAATEMRTTLNAGQLSIESGTLAIKAHLDSVAERLSETEAALSPLEERFQALGSGSTTLTTSFESLAEKAGHLDDPLGSLHTRFGTLSADVGNASTRLTSLSEALSHTLTIAQRVEDVAASLERSLGPLDDFAKRAESFANVGSGADDLSAAIQRGKESVTQFAESLRAADGNVKRIAQLPEHLDFEALEGLSGTLEKQLSGLEASVEAWRAGANDLTTLIGTMGERQRAAAEALLQVQEELKASVAILTMSIDGEEPHG